ncbi:MAG: hypothetical protein B7X55_12110 [Rhodobacterales bacterium 34-62-10]|nr:MAG: hypothetical protein B7X55_12110 [Rhodobacterales bacterium 34-62-10]
MARPGRPRSDTEGITLRLPREVLARIDEMRRVEKDIPTRQEMVRRVIEKVLTTPAPPTA